jgi:hypothetical protein
LIADSHQLIFFTPAKKKHDKYKECNFQFSFHIRRFQLSELEASYEKNELSDSKSEKFGFVRSCHGMTLLLSILVIVGPHHGVANNMAWIWLR